MASLNKVQVIGNLGRDPEVRYTPNGNAVCNVSVATTRQWKNKESGDKSEETEWHRGKRPRANQFPFLVPDGLAGIIEDIDSHPQALTLDLAGPHRENRTAEYEAGGDVGPSRD